jgi:nicotinate-nucleotide adenylyltransferase
MLPLVGLFGGTFDPPHIGHLILAAEAYSQLQLDRLFWILTPNPPHKKNQTITPIEHRLAMVRLALADAPSFELCTVDVDRPAPHYALDTVKIIASQQPASHLVYVMGGDSLRDLPTWYRPVDFLALLQELAVMHRPGESIDLPSLGKKIPGLALKTRFLDTPLIDIAAHEIRRRIAQDRPFRYFLPPSVYEYIHEHNLYQFV